MQCKTQTILPQTSCAARDGTTKTIRWYSRIAGGLSLVVMLAGFLLGSWNVPLAHATAFTDSFAPLPRSGSGSTALYNAFPDTVQHHPKVYLVFWGPKWTSDSYGIIYQVQLTFQNLAGTQYNNILSQYTDTNNTTYNGGPYVNDDVQYMDTWIDTTSSPGSYIDIANEVSDEEKTAAHHFGLPYGNLDAMHDVQIEVFPQQGTSYATAPGSDPCGMHYYDGTSGAAYSMVRHAADIQNCTLTGSFNSTAQGMAWTAVHEYAEAATDRVVHFSSLSVYGNGWQTHDNTYSPDEVADLCEAYYPRQANSNDSTFYVYNGQTNSFYLNGSSYLAWPTVERLYLPFLWSNRANGCVMSQGQEFGSPDFNAPFHGIHTLQGAILAAYQNGLNTLLGRPMSDELLMSTTGRVSYFELNGCGTNSGIYWSDTTGPHAVWGCIMAHYKAMGEGTSPIGFPSSDEMNAPGGGRVNYFGGTLAYSHCGNPGPYASYAAIYWTGSEADAVKGCIYDYYINIAGGPAGSMGLGLPHGEEGTLSNGGHYQYFAGSSCGTSSYGSIVYDVSGDGIHAVKGCIYAYYNGIYGGPGGIGFPTSDELSMGGGHGQHFAGTGGCSGGCGLYDGPGTGIHLVIGGIYGKYLSMGEANSFLGFPTYDETGVSIGRVSYFGGTTWGSNCGSYGPYNSHAAIYYTDSTGAHEVHGCIYNAYVNWFGGPSEYVGNLGFPTSDEATLSNGGHQQSFEHGTIYDDPYGNITEYICPPSC